jgi:hypothetical protein
MHAQMRLDPFGFAENHLAKIMSAKRSFAVSSGMSALDVIVRLVRAGEEIIAGDDLYGGETTAGRLAVHLTKRHLRATTALPFFYLHFLFFHFNTHNQALIACLHFSTRTLT